MTTHAERYRDHWSTLTGRTDVYTPEALREPEQVATTDVVTLPEYIGLKGSPVRHVIKHEANALVGTWCGTVIDRRTRDGGDYPERRVCNACRHNRAAEAERRTAREWRFR